MTRLTLPGRRALHRLTARLATDEHGAVTIIVAFSMVVVLGMAALVIDIGGAEVRKAQLQDAADAAATALASQCFDAAGTTVNFCDASITGSAATSALWYAQKALGDLPVSVSGIVWTSNTVKVSLVSNQASVFAKIFNVDSMNISAAATAQWGLPAVALPLAYNECNLPAPSSNSKAFLRYDLLALDLQGCGLIGGVLNELGNGWLSTPNCTFDVNVLTYLTDVLTKVVPTNCAAKVASLNGKYVLLPVYNHVLTNIVVNGVLIGQGYQVQKYALVQVSGYDFSTLSINGLIATQIGPSNISGNPQCPSVNLGILTVKEPTCQGLQGYFVQYLTPAQTAARLNGVQLIS